MIPPDPSEPSAAARDVERARVALSLRRFAASEQYAREALRRDPHNHEALLVRGHALLGLTRYLDAERVIRDVLARSPGDVRALYLLGWVLLAMGRVVESVDVLQEAVRRAPDAGLCWSQLALAHVARGRHFEARRCAERALSLGGDGAPQLLDDVARVYLATGDLDVAERCARDAIAASPQDAHARLLLAAVHGRGGRVAEAVACAREAVSLDPNCHDAWAELGLSLAKTAEFAEAEAALSEAIRLNGGARACVRARVEVLLRRGEREQAAVALRAALHQFPHDPVLAHLDAVLRQPPPKSPPPKSPPPKSPPPKSPPPKSPPPPGASPPKGSVPKGSPPPRARPSGPAAPDRKPERREVIVVKVRVVDPSTPARAAPPTPATPERVAPPTWLASLRSALRRLLGR